jgi:hypothetical protein
MAALLLPRALLRCCARSGWGAAASPLSSVGASASAGRPAARAAPHAAMASRSFAAAAAVPPVLVTFGALTAAVAQIACRRSGSAPACPFLHAPHSHVC